jgi:hypothetical protein
MNAVRRYRLAWLAVGAGLLLPPPAAAPAQLPGSGADRILQRAQGYERWERFPRYVRPVRSQGHRDHYVVAFHNPIASRAAKGADIRYPEGSLIVKENRPTADRPPLTLSIMAMLHDGWFWIEATPEGRVVIEKKQPRAGKLRNCIRCHQRAGADLVYSDGID